MGSTPRPRQGSPARRGGPPVRSDEHRLAAAGRDLVIAGLVGAGVVTAGHLGTALGILDGRLAAAGPPAAYLGAVGWLLGSAGSLRVGRVLAASRADLRGTVVTSLGTAVAWAAAVVVYARLPTLPGRAHLFAVLAVLLAAVALLRHRPALHRLGQRSLVSMGLVLYVTAFAWAGLAQVEAYPFAPFQMYAAPRLAPYEVAVPRLVATATTGQEVDLRTGAGPATLRSWLDDPDEDRVRTTVLDIMRTHEAATGQRLLEVRVVRDVWTVPPYDAPAAPVLAEREVVLRVAP